MDLKQVFRLLVHKMYDWKGDDIDARLSCTMPWYTSKLSLESLAIKMVEEMVKFSECNASTGL